MKDEELFRKTDGVLFNYKTIKAEIYNLEIEIEELKAEYEGVKAVGYEQRSSPTNKFSSIIEDEIIKKDKLIAKLLKEKSSKERLISKIDNALNTLDDTEKEIIRLRCFERNGWNKVGIITNMDGDYCGRVKRKAVNKLSELIWISNKYTE